MKLVTAVIQPQALENVQIALHKHGINGMTITEVSGYARQRGHSEIYRGAEYTIDFVGKVKVEILAEDADVDEIIQVIVESARTGQIGDGKVWSVPVETVVRVRTGERGDAAV